MTRETREGCLLHYDFYTVDSEEYDFKLAIHLEDTINRLPVICCQLQLSQSFSRNGWKNALNKHLREFINLSGFLRTVDTANFGLPSSITTYLIK
jgi:hypothetical protein